MNLPSSLSIYFLFGVLVTIRGQPTEVPSNFTFPAGISMASLPTTKSAEQIAAEKTEEKRVALFSKIVDGFAGDDEKKKAYLREPYKAVPEVGTCYLEAYGTFLANCCVIKQYHNLYNFKHLCHRICAAGWFETEDIWTRLGEICNANADLKIE